MKLTHFLSNELLSRMMKQLSISNFQQMRTGRVPAAIVCATREGIFEIVFEMVKQDPLFVFSHDAVSSNIFSVAVQYRRAKIFSLIYGLSTKNGLAGTVDSFNRNNLLHMAGMSAPSTSLDHIAGAALQMQREVQWFKVISLTFNFLVFIYWLYVTLKLLIIKVFNQAVTVGYKLLLWPFRIFFGVWLYYFHWYRNLQKISIFLCEY